MKVSEIVILLTDEISACRWVLEASLSLSGSRQIGFLLEGSELEDFTFKAYL